MQFKDLLVLASLALSSYAQTTVAQIEKDINDNIAPTLSALLNAIEAFPVDGGILNLPQALEIQTAALNLDNAIVATTNDVNGAACPIEESDAQDILADFKALLPNIQQSLADIIARKDAIQSLSVGEPNLPLQELDTLSQHANALSSAFSSAFAACAPADVIASGLELKTEIDNAFGSAVDAYS